MLHIAGCYEKLQMRLQKYNANLIEVSYFQSNAEIYLKL